MITFMVVMTKVKLFNDLANYERVSLYFFDNRTFGFYFTGLTSNIDDTITMNGTRVLFLSTLSTHCVDFLYCLTITSKVNKSK
jgi:hypothetical protein